MLETKIAHRLQELNAAQAESEKQLEAEQTQLKQQFEAHCKQAVDLAISVGVAKDKVTHPAYGESSVPYASFTVAGVPCALELRTGLLTLKVNNTHQGDFSLEADDLKNHIEQALVEAIAQHAHSGGEVQLPGAKES
jgi:hypothetical protein